MTRLWMSVAVALWAAVCGDALTEWLANGGFWGAGPLDLHQESLAPTAVVAAVVSLSLACYAVARRRRVERPWDGVALALALGVVVVMEGYEVRFGGAGVFDPRSVLAGHLLPVLGSYLVIALAVNRLMALALRAVMALGLSTIAMLVSGGVGRGAEATTGTIVGVVRATNGVPIADARIVANSGSGRYQARSDPRGVFVILGVAADTYVISVRAEGYADASQDGIVLFPGGRAHVTFVLAPTLRTIGTVRSRSSSFEVGATSDTFSVSGAQAQARAPVTSTSGLGNYLSGSVQGAIAAVPGVESDTFANAILRGGEIFDAAFEYDSVPIPQGLVAEPGGNIAGAQLPTTGIAAATVTLAGYESQSENALGGIIDEVPATGAYPGHVTSALSSGFGAQQQSAAVDAQWASPDLRWRYAFATTLSSEYFAYGDGSTFYPAEAGTYGLALQSRATASVSGNIHVALTPRDDLSLVVLAGQAAYDQYGTPFAGETLGAFNPGASDPNAPVTYASGVRGNYGLVKLGWARTSSHALSRIQLYQSRYGSSAGGPFWDDLSFPDGVIALSAQQAARTTGLAFDVDDAASDRHEIKYGLDYRVSTSSLQQVVPTAHEYITSNPTLQSFLAYTGDTWSISHRLDLTGALRLSSTNVVPSYGSAYTIAALDPHLSASYRIGALYALRATYDHNTVAPAPLETDRVDSANATPSGSPAPFVALAPEVGRNATLSFEGGGHTQVRATYYASNQTNLIDVLPYNFRSAIAAGESPNGVGVPTNAGELHAHGFELWAHNGKLELDANLVRAYSSSASQFAFNDLNAAAVAAGHLFPVGYVPDFSAVLSYELDFARRRLRITPSLSYESGYPYGNGKMIWIFDPVTNKPEQVPNDNYHNPGYNYYFLENPAQPYNAQTNPYIGSLGTPEGNDPNTLRTPPQTVLSLHVEADLTARVTLLFDAFNVLDVTSPTQLQGNPYLIGPPGYAGGNANYAAAYAAYAGFAAPYTLGNGVPTNNGMTPALPWSYGRAGYVPMSYPMARTAQLRLRVRLP